MNITDQERTQLIDKVQKLLAMAEGTTFPGEATSFRAKAADLMAKYAITHNEFADTSAPFMIVDLDLGGEDPETWRVYLVDAICRFNGMLCITHTTRALGATSKVIKLTGKASDHAAFTYMYDCVLRQMGSEMINYMDKNKKYTATDRAQFCLGFAYGLNNKVSDLMKARDTKIQEYGIVPIDEVQRARTWYEQQFGKLTKGKAGSNKFANDGFNAGKNANLNKGVNGTSGNRLAIGM